jgi:hypothetical protein
LSFGTTDTLSSWRIRSADSSTPFGSPAESQRICAIFHSAPSGAFFLRSDRTCHASEKRRQRRRPIRRGR